MITDPRADDTQRALAVCSVLAGNAVEGRFDEADRVFAVRATTIVGPSPTLPYALAIAEVATTIRAHMQVGSTKPTCSPPPCTSARCATETTGPCHEARPGWEPWRCCVASRGRRRALPDRGRVVATTFDEMYRRYTLSWLARAAALAGLVDEAEAALDDARGAPDLAIFRPDWYQAEAAVLAARIARARRRPCTRSRAVGGHER